MAAGGALLGTLARYRRRADPAGHSFDGARIRRCTASASSGRVGAGELRLRRRGITWMGSAGPWMGSLGLSMDFSFFKIILIYRGGHLIASVNTHLPWRLFGGISPARLGKLILTASENVFCSSARGLGGPMARPALCHSCLRLASVFLSVQEA